MLKAHRAVTNIFFFLKGNNKHFQEVAEENNKNHDR